MSDSLPVELDADRLLAEGRALRALARSLVGDADADDVVHDGFVAALRRPAGIRAGGAWLAGTVKKLALRWRRGEGRRRLREQRAGPSGGETVDPARLAAQAEALHAVARAVHELEDPFRSVVVLRFWHELPTRAIAERLAVPHETVRSRLQRGLTRLRERLDADRGGRALWMGGLGVFAANEPAIAAAGAVPAIGIATGILMQTKLVVVGTAAVAAVCVIAWSWSLSASREVSPIAERRAVPAHAAAPVLVAAASGSAPAGGPTVSERTAAAAPAVGGFVLRGRAVSFADTPVPQAKVRARAFAGTAAKGDPAIDAELITDDSGNFAWSLPVPAALTFFDFRGAGDRVRSLPETFVLAPGDAPPPAFDLWIMPLTAIVRGRVLDPDGVPIGGARVGIEWRGGVRTAPDGSFEVFAEARKSVRLYAAARGFVDLQQEVAVDLAKREGYAQLRLRTANRIHGRVTDIGQRPVAGAVVRTFHTIFADGDETDADGRFVLDNLDPSLASHSLFARKEGYVEAKAEVNATSPDVEQDLVLCRGIEVRGVVVGPRGEPIPAATVFLGFSPSAYNRLDAVSQLDGTFVFPCVSAGEQTLNVERAGYAGRRQKIDVPPAPSAAIVVRVELDVGHFVAGRTIDAGGKPVAGVSIWPRLDGEYLEGIRTRTDADGRFRLEGLPARGLVLEFGGVGLLRKKEPVPDVDRDDLEVVLERSGRMAGIVVDGRTGKPIPEFRLRYGVLHGDAWSDQSGGGTLFHDAGGVFRLDGVGRIGSVFAFEASAEGYGASIDDQVEVSLDPDPAKNVIALYPGRTIDGVVRERATSLPIAGARVKAVARSRPLQHQPNDDVGRPIAETDARGVFRLDNVGVGEVSLAVAHTDWLPVTHGPIHVTPDGAVPMQEVVLDHGSTVHVDVRDAASNPIANADLELACGLLLSMRARSDAAGVARFEGVPPGESDLALVESAGTAKLWTFRRTVTVEHQDRRVEFVAKDGDATLVVTVDCPEPLPEGTGIMVMHKGGSRWARGAWLRPGRTVIPLLPARELQVVVTTDEWHGAAVVSTIAGQQVEVRVAMSKLERGR